jgi:hypothetical protein
MEAPDEDENPPLETILAGTMVDDHSPEAPARASLAGCDEARTRKELLARMRRGELSLRERSAALMLASRVSIEKELDALGSLLGDGALALSARSLALALLQASPEGAQRAAALAPVLGDALFARIGDEKLVVELVLQLPAPGMADGLARALLGVPEVLRDGVYARLERCRRRAGLPALVAWRRALHGPELSAFHDRMAAVVMDEAGEGTSVAVEMLWRNAPDDEARRVWGRIVAAIEPRAGRQSRPPPRGSTHRIDTPDAPTQWMVCVEHPERMTLVARAYEREGQSLAVDGVFVLPSEPSVSVTSTDGRPITMSYRVMSLDETRERAVRLARRMSAEGQRLPHDLCLLLCLLDGLPSTEGSVPAFASGAS